ncbi:hypothetical protein [Methanosarcina sp. UBA5]|uniref:hypothetical protein n=1 Tax=Methanosarcina sp. UBA5 TaxID=1915593 RepID=UPI0025DB01FE|nr:hypothetical protein [Methanosarcina sp. UBA5]
MLKKALKCLASTISNQYVDLSEISRWTFEEFKKLQKFQLQEITKVTEQTPKEAIILTLVKLEFGGIN